MHEESYLDTNVASRIFSSEISVGDHLFEILRQIFGSHVFDQNFRVPRSCRTLYFKRIKTLHATYIDRSEFEKLDNTNMVRSVFFGGGRHWGAAVRS